MSKNAIKQINKMIDEDKQEKAIHHYMDRVHDNVSALEDQIGTGTIDGKTVVSTLCDMRNLLDLITDKVLNK